MPHDPYVAAKLHALAVALLAKCNQVSADDVRDLITTKDRHLDPTNPLATSIDRFVETCRAHRGEAQAMYAAGTELIHAIDMANLPAQPDMFRKDIYG